jgi:hypothetical protein
MVEDIRQLFLPTRKIGQNSSKENATILPTIMASLSSMRTTALTASSHQLQTLMILNPLEDGPTP